MTTLSHTNSEFARIATTDAAGNVTGVTVQDFTIADLANFSLPGGTAGQVLTTDGTGVLSWANSTGGGGTISVGTGGSETFIATAGQVLFTIASVPNGTVGMTINGIQVATTAATNVGTAVTYVPAQNAGYVLKTGDRVVLTYIYGSTSVGDIAGLSDVTITTPAAGQVLSFDAGTSKWVNVPGATSFGLVANGTSNVSIANNGNVTVGVTGSANVATFAADGVTIAGNLSVIGSNVSLGDVANVTITGGTVGQALVSLGGGDVAFQNASRLVTAAYSSQSLAIPAGFVAATVIYNEKMYDPQSLYDIATGRFQPKIAGWYQIAFGVDAFVNSSTNADSGVVLTHSVDGDISGTSSLGAIICNGTGTAYFNGTTDYAYVSAKAATATTRTQSRRASSFTAFYLSI
jgi:hypothetical protein